MRMYAGIFMLSLVALMCACGSGDIADKNNPVAASIDNQSGPTGNISFNISFAPWKSTVAAKVAAIEAIDSIVAYVYDSGNNELAEQAMTITNGQYSGSVSVQAQDNLRVALVFYDGDIVRYIGEDSDVDVPAGGDTTAEVVEEYMGTTVTSPETANAGDEYTVSWMVRPFVTGYLLQEDTATNFSDADTIYESTGVSTTVTQSSAGTYYYRACVNTVYGYGPWHSTGGANTGIEAVEGTIIIGGDVPPDEPGSTNIYNGITFVSVPSGSFQMGDIQGGGFSNESPVHAVTITGFEMSTTEITQGQYQELIGNNPSYFSGLDSPVEQVSWYDAVIFCNRLSDAMEMERCYNESTWDCDYSKKGFRLPTEAEWEYACRAGTETRNYSGNNDSDLDSIAWYGYNKGGNSNLSTHPVGGKEANSFELYDMSGNVWEWCNDWADEDYYSISPDTDPTGPVSGTNKIIRGGAWGYVEECRSAYRGVGVNDLNLRHYHLGFRPVRRP